MPVFCGVYADGLSEIAITELAAFGFKELNHLEAHNAVIFEGETR